MGGTLAAIEAGFIQRQIQESAYTAQLAIDSAEAVVVGVNRYAEKGVLSQPLFRLDPEGERRQTERVRTLRSPSRRRRVPRRARRGRGSSK